MPLRQVKEPSPVEKVKHVITKPNLIIMKSVYTKYRTLLFLTGMLLTIVMTSCEKEPQSQDNDNQFVPVNCTFDLLGNDIDGLSVISFGSGAVLESNSAQLYVQESVEPQLFIVADQDNHVRLLYRGIVKEGDSVEFNVHSSALALIMSNPFIALVGKTDYSWLTTIVEQLTSFQPFEFYLEEQISLGKDLCDTNNTMMLRHIKAVYDELLGSEPEPIDGMGMPGADLGSLHFEWVDQSRGVFSFRNYFMVPAYYGDMNPATPEGSKMSFMVPTVDDFRPVGDAGNLLWNDGDTVYGKGAVISLQQGMYHSFSLTNLHNSGAMFNIGRYLLNRLLDVVRVKLSSGLASDMSTTAGRMVADAVDGVAQGGGEAAMQRRASAIGSNVYRYIQDKIDDFIVKTDVYDACELFDKAWAKRSIELVVGKVFALHNVVEGTTNLSKKIYYLLRYPNDIAFCIKYDYDNSLGPCCDAGLFSVAENKLVEFAPGNLAEGGRSFVNHQWEFGGYFGWGTGNKPNNMSYDYDDYQTFYDWGNYIVGGWRTLSIQEWHYVLFDRENADQKYGASTVNDVRGLVLLPDTFMLPPGCMFNAGMVRWNQNIYDVNMWQMMEERGAVFLPLAGARVDGGGATGSGEWGYFSSTGLYWSSSTRIDLIGQYGYEHGACCLAFYITEYGYNPGGHLLADEHNWSHRYYGFSVRLARDRN